MAGFFISLSHLKFKQRLIYIIIAVWFFTFITFFYYRLDYSEIYSEISTDFNKNIDLQTPKILILNPLNDTYYSDPPTVQINITNTFGINQTWYLILEVVRMKLYGKFSGNRFQFMADAT